MHESIVSAYPCQSFEVNEYVVPGCKPWVFYHNFWILGKSNDTITKLIYVRVFYSS